MKVPQLDLARFYQKHVEEWCQNIHQIAASGRIINGSFKKQFEGEFAQYLEVRHALGVASGTDALWLALRASGIGHGDEVILHANAFVANVEAILAAGARPVLVDKSAHDYGPDLEQVRAAISPRCKAIMVVHLCGLPVDLDPLCALAVQHGLALIEDSSQAQGASYHGKKVGCFGRYAAFSLGPVKNLACMGDGGCVVTQDDEHFEKLRYLGVHGQIKKYDHALYGWNSRLDEVSAAWLLIGLKSLDLRNQCRADIYRQYRAAFAQLPLTPMPDFHDRTCVFHQAIFESAQRDALKTFLGERGIETGAYYPTPLHLQSAWHATQLPKGHFPRAEQYCRENLSLPVFPELTEAEMSHVIDSVKAFFA